MSSALRVTNVGEVVEACRVQDVVDKGGHVFESEVGLPVVPVLTVVRREAQVTLAVEAATVVAKPHIVALVGEDKRVGLIGIVHNILHHVGIEGVHEKYGGLDTIYLWLLQLREGAWDTVKRKDVVVRGHNSVLFHLVPVLEADLLEGLSSIDGRSDSSGERQNGEFHLKDSSRIFIN